ncbi:hypothetical protein [Acinetobacter larvae]|uniref:Uncharacterized protein n=1 Tax=Acinetobacter larvae TaxID=1789224 RepID=A0A1B2LZ87_9GAMM|nr:hypothetical protein [Acinetobacter larvae]AOA58272.1 hypothetical protein BFG52_07820 [Acinetobacter larvae]
MSFKYQAPVHYKAKTLVIAGKAHQVTDGVIESVDDIYPLLVPLGFSRYNGSVAKKPTAAVKN